MKEIKENLVLEDFLCLLPLIPPVCIFSKSVLIHCKLVRDEKNRVYKVERLPEMALKNSKDRLDLDPSQINEEVLECLEIFDSLLKTLPHVDRSSFYNNLNPQGIELVKMSRLDSVSGYYYPLTDKIVVDLNNIRGAIFHELIHLASTRKYGEKIFSGFRQFEVGGIKGKEHVKYSIGTGINECYAQLLTERYFLNEGCLHTYGTIKDFAYYIEALVGQEEMERAFFNSDLYYVVERISEYSSFEEASKLIKKIDHFYEAIYENWMLFPKYMVKSTYKEIILILTKMFMRKISIALINGEKIDSKIIDDLSSLIDLRKNCYFTYSLGVIDHLKIKKIIDKEVTNSITHITL